MFILLLDSGFVISYLEMVTNEIIYLDMITDKTLYVNNFFLISMA